MEWLLSRKGGMYILPPSSKGVSSTHIVAVNSEVGLLYDPMELVAWKLCEKSLAASTGKPDSFVGIGELRLLAKQRATIPLLKRTRGGRGKIQKGKRLRD